MKINILKFILALIVSTLFLSCGVNSIVKKEDENTYQIINKLTEKIKEQSLLHPVFPPPPLKKNYAYTTKDSLNKYKYFYDQYTKRKVIALKKNMFELPKNRKLVLDECLLKKELKKRNLPTHQRRIIDINKLSLSKKDSLIYYTKNYENTLEKGFNRINFLISFSIITFNNDYTKAFLVMNVRYEKLDSFSTAIYLEKKNYQWEIVCEKRLTIS